MRIEKTWWLLLLLYFSIIIIIKEGEILTYSKCVFIYLFVPFSVKSKKEDDLEKKNAEDIEDEQERIE